MILIRATFVLSFLSFSLFHFVKADDESAFSSDTCSDTLPLTRIGDEWSGNLLDAAVSDTTDSCLFNTGGSQSAWYRVQGTGVVTLVSTCSATTNFDTILSVYRGSCDALECVTGNDDSFQCDAWGTASAVEFYAETDVIYHVRVQAYGSFDSIGDFSLTVSESVPLSLPETCQAFAEDFYFDTTCDCVENQEEEQVDLECEDTCLYCRNTDYCFETAYVDTFELDDEGNIPFIASSQYTFTVVGDGPFTGTVVSAILEECTGLDYECTSCQLYVNGDECNGCAFVPFTNEYGESYETVQLDCMNLFPEVPVFNIDDVPPPPELDNTPLQALASDSSEGGCLIPTNGACGILDTLPILTMDGSNETGSTVGTEMPFVNPCLYGEPRPSGVVYTLTGQGTGVEISSCYPGVTTFNMRISVLGGDCNYLECLNERFAYGDCGGGLTFFAEMDQVYYIVIQGAAEDETGAFEISASSINAAFYECENNHLFSYQDSFKGQTCTCTQAGESEANLSCENGCDYCTPDRESCALETWNYEIDASGGLSSSTRTLTFSTGSLQDQDIVFTAYECDYQLFGCSGCNLAVNGEECNACEIVNCPDFNAGFAFDCSNLSTGAASFNTCDAAPDVGDGALQIFANDICIIDPLEVCESQNEFGDCACQETDFGAVSTCPGCRQCNVDETVCATNSYGTIYDSMGQISGDVRSFTYTEGRTETVTQTSFFDSGDCVVVVDGVECNECTYNFACEQGYTEMYVDCENVESGAVFDRCDYGSINQGGVLQVFNDGENDFYDFFSCVFEELPTYSPYPSTSPYPTYNSLPGETTPAPKPVEEPTKPTTGAPVAPSKGKGATMSSMMSSRSGKGSSMMYYYKGKGSSMYMMSSSSKGGKSSKGMMAMMMGGKGGMMVMMGGKGGMSMRRALHMARSAHRPFDGTPK